jgi:ADP-ribosyl-[dinitrogen reductase] hydrolase
MDDEGPTGQRPGRSGPGTVGPAPVPRAVVPPLHLGDARGDARGAAVERQDAPQGPSPVSRDRVVGVVLGAAVGDALGAPFEFAPRGTFSARLPDRRPDGQGDMIGGGAFAWEPGEFTDDTQMGLALAASLLARGGYDPDDLWVRWRTWARTSSDVGNTTRFALGHRDWRTVVHPDPEATAANGALMRAFPLALATLGTDQAAARAVTLHQALLTHEHPAAAWGAWLGVAMMRAAVLGDDPLLSLDVELSELAEHDVVTAPRFVAMLDPGWDPTDGDAARIGNGSVWGCLAQAVWALRRHDRLADVLADVVELGKDTDTVACVAGAIAGARDGASAIPVGWSGPVHGVLDAPDGQERYGREELASVAVALAASAGRTLLD